MTAILKIDECDMTPARLTGKDVLAMTKAGILREGRGHELIEGVLGPVDSYLEFITPAQR